MFLALVAIVQVMVVPGFLALRFARIKTGSCVEAGVLVIALSLLLNYLGVFLAATLGIYTRSFLAGVLVLEAAAVFSLVLRQWRRGGETLAEFKVLRPHTDRVLSETVVFLAIAVFLAAAFAAISASLRVNVFDACDPLLGWNRWAYEWADGAVPLGTNLYPQLLPANWSIMYLITGSRELQQLPLSIIPLLALAIPAMFLDLGLRRRRLEYLIATVLCIAMAAVPNFLIRPDDSVYNGYAEIPLVFLAAAALYLLELRDDRRPSNWRDLALPLIVACAAALTKVNGFAVVAGVLALSVLGHLAKRRELSVRDWGKSAVLVVVVLGLLLGTWFTQRSVALSDALSYNPQVYMEASRTAGDQGIVAGAMNALSRLPGSWNTVYAFLAAIALATLVSRSRWVGLTALLPYSLAWAVLASYDWRNALMIVPLAVYVAAFAVGWIVHHLLRDDLQLVVSPVTAHARRQDALAFVLAGSILLATVCAANPKAAMVADSLAAQRMIGAPAVNQMLYRNLDGGVGISGDVLTDYPHLNALPLFRNVGPLRLDNNPAVHVAYIYQLAATPEMLEGKDFLVLSTAIPGDMNALIDERLSTGEYSLIEQVKVGPFQQWGEEVSVRLIRVNAELPE